MSPSPGSRAVCLFRSPAAFSSARNTLSFEGLLLPDRVLDWGTSLTHSSAAPRSGRRFLVQPDGFILEAAMAFLQKLFHECWICGHEVSLEECKIDEHGQAVHEECYVVALALRGTPKPDGKKSVQIQSDLMPKHEPLLR